MNDNWWTDAEGTAHERCQLIFVSTGETVPFDPGEEPYMRWPRQGWALYCPHCVEIWERIIMIDSRGQQRGATVISVACAKHFDQWNVPGSVLAGELEYLLRHLPRGVLQREFAIHIRENNLERFANDRQDLPDPTANRSESAAGGANRHG